MLDDPGVDGEAVKAITGLFYIVLSGTRAPLAIRLRVLKDLLKSNTPVDQRLGLKALEAMMETDHFVPYSNFEFGARSRGYGYQPKNGPEVGHWFEEVLRLAEPLALASDPISVRVRKSIARQFRGLWRDGGRVDALERIAKAISCRGFWRDGWVAARQTRQYDGDGLEAEFRRRLTELEECLRPKDLVNSVRGIVLVSGGGSLDLDDFKEDEEEEDGKESHAGRITGATITVEVLAKMLPVTGTPSRRSCRS